GEGHRDLGRGDGDDEEGEHRPAAPLVLAGGCCGDEQHESATEDELDPDEHEDRVATRQRAVDADPDEKGGEDVGTEQAHASASPRSGASVDEACAGAVSSLGRSIRETANAATSALSNRTERSSNGQTHTPKRSRAITSVLVTVRSGRTATTGTSTARRSAADAAPSTAASTRRRGPTLTSVCAAIGLRVSMRAKRTRTTIAPTKMRTWTSATNSAPMTRKQPASAPSDTTSQSAACTTRVVVTASRPQTTAMSPKVAKARSSPVTRSPPPRRLVWGHVA